MFATLKVLCYRALHKEGLHHHVPYHVNVESKTGVSLKVERELSYIYHREAEQPCSKCLEDAPHNHTYKVFAYGWWLTHVEFIK